jgi:hypothetical protein
VNVRIGFCVIQRATILTCFLTCFTGTAFAVDGVVLIDQTRALAGNVTPGDAPGFLVTLSLPGSYRLSGNLTAPAGTDGILIQNSDITLDLNGFRITGGPERAEDVFGITDRGVAHRGILIRNGAMTNLGIDMTSNQVEVREMRIAHANFAIRIWGDIAVVTGNSVSGSFTAIRIDGFDAIITDNIVSKNGSGIVSFSAAALIRGNNSSFNQFRGIRAPVPAP